MNWNILIGAMLVIAGIGGAAASDDPSDVYETNDEAEYDPEYDPDYDTDYGSTGAADGDGDSDEAPVSFRDVHRCVHKLDHAFHKAHGYGQHIKQQMRAIEHRITMLELKEMRLSNALDDIVVGAPIDENQTAKLEQILKRAHAALEQDPGPRKEAYLMQVINRTEAALEEGVWTQDDVDSIEKQLERIQAAQDKLLRKYLELKQKLGDLRDRFTDFLTDKPCKPDVRPMPADRPVPSDRPVPGDRPDGGDDKRPDGAGSDKRPEHAGSHKATANRG